MKLLWCISVLCLTLFSSALAGPIERVDSTLDDHEILCALEILQDADLTSAAGDDTEFTVVLIMGGLLALLLILNGGPLFQSD